MALFNPSASPAVVVREVDLTGGVPNVQSSTGVFVGNFNWGPVEQRTLINTEAQLASTFTSPTRTNAVDFISAAKFLTYSQSLYVTRMINETQDQNGLPVYSAHNAYGNPVPANPTYTLTDADIKDYTDVAGDPGVGTTALAFVVTNDNSNNYLVSFTNGGTDYSVGDTFVISGADLGGTDTTHDLTITVDSLDVNGAIDAITISGVSTPDDDFVPFTIKNKDEFDSLSLSQDHKDAKWIARFPGAVGDSLLVSTFEGSADQTAWEAWTYANNFNGKPDAGEVHVVVIDENGAFSGVEGALLEAYSFVSTNETDKNDDGTTNYINDVVNQKSNYVYCTAETFSGAETYAFGQGADTVDLNVGDYQTGFNLYEDPETVTVDFLIAPSMVSRENHRSVINHLVGLAQQERKDCIVIASPAKSDMNYFNAATIVNETITTFSTIPDSSYLFVDNNFLKVYDKYNDVYINIPAASSTAGIMAATDLNAAPWFSPAGTRRGAYFGITNIQYSPTKGQRDELYKAGINPIANIPGQGILLYGDKMHMQRSSAFDRVNVRRLFLVLERAIAAAAKNVIFELNDEFTRAEFVNIIEPVLREVQGRRGITDYRVIADETNNTPAVIDRNEFIANIFIKPTRSINFVTLNFVAVRTGVSFEEVVGTV